MFCNSEKKEVLAFRFSRRSYSLSEAIMHEYRDIRKMHKRATGLLLRYRKKDSWDRKHSIAIIQYCLGFYNSCGKLLNVLFTEILKPKTNLKHKRPIFVLLEKLSQMFYLFDKVRFRENQVFHNFALIKQSGKPCLSEKKVLELTSFLSISMPMAHLFLSSFTSNRVELHIPTVLFKRNLVHLDKNRKEILHFMCSLLCSTDFRFLAMYLCAVYNRFFEKDGFQDFAEGLSEQMFFYYRAMLLLN